MLALQHLFRYANHSTLDAGVPAWLPTTAK
jgi:hypothetical protein